MRSIESWLRGIRDRITLQRRGFEDIPSILPFGNAEVDLGPIDREALLRVFIDDGNTEGEDVNTRSLEIQIPPGARIHMVLR